MFENKRYCMNCMKEIDEHTSICPHCQYDGSSAQQSPYLRQGTAVAGRYLVGKSVAMANDSITYIGIDNVAQTPVYVCEYFPHKIAQRANGTEDVYASDDNASLYNSCLESFLGLWRGLKMFDNVRSLPVVFDIVTENNTAYAVFERKEAMSVKEYFEKTRRPLTYSKSIAIFKPVLVALKTLHNAGIIHGNITPSTLLVGPDGRLMLTGFSIPQCRSEIIQLNSRPVNGFSPIEIYQTYTAKPESDIYSVMAVMYYTITGTVLKPAPQRVNAAALTVPSSIASTIPPNVLDAMSRALAVYPKNRISTVDELIECLNSNSSAASVVQKRSENMAQRNTQRPQQRTSQQKPQQRSAQQRNTQQRSAQQRPPQHKVQSGRPAAGRKPASKKKEPPVALLGVGAFLAAMLVISILFCALYGTVLYKSFDVPFLDKAFASMTFLPMNSGSDYEDEEATLPSDFEPSNTETSYATVANFTKLTYDYIIANDSFRKNFTFKFKNENSDTVEKGGIISQNLAPGESVPVGTKIVLVVSLGKEQIAVPDVIGKTYDEAKSILKEEGFKVKKELVENTEENTPGEVCTMSELPGVKADKGTEIVLGVWDELPETTTEETTTKESTTKEATTKETTTKKPTTTKPTTTKPTTTKPSTTKPTTTKPTTTEKAPDNSISEDTDK